MNPQHRGPINPRHQKYVNNDKLIIKALCAILRDRRINVRTAELYKLAKVSSPTFYLHYRDANDARYSYERRLSLELAERVPKHARPQLFFTILMSLIKKHYSYFAAVAVSGDHYLLSKMLLAHRKHLVSSDVDDCSFIIYASHLQAIIGCWLWRHKHNDEPADRCVQDLLKVQPQ